MKQTENLDKAGREWYFGIEAKTAPNEQKNIRCLDYGRG